MASLKELRQARGITQEQLANDSGLRQATVSALENGRTNAQAGTIQALANALAEDPEEIRIALAEQVSSSPSDSVRRQRKKNRSLESIDPETLGKLSWNWKNALRATEGQTRQWKEAMMFLSPVLKKHPEFLEARKLLRRAELEADLKIPISDRIPPPQSYIAKASKLNEDGDPVSAMEMLEEKVFVYLPRSIKAGEALFDAAISAGFPETARYALEFAAEFNPNDKHIHQRLASYLHDIGDLEHACEVLRLVVAIDPEDIGAPKALRDMMALASMRGGKIEIKDHQETVALQRAERIGSTEEQKKTELDSLIQSFEKNGRSEEAQLAGEACEDLRRAVQLARELGEADLSSLELALRLQVRLSEILPQDPILRSQVDELNLEVHTRKLEAAEADEQDGDDSKIESLRREKLNAEVEFAENLALVNPTSAEAHLRLGKAYAAAARFKEAVRPLQKAKNDPRLGIDIEAMSLLSDCFINGGLKELAVKEIDKALEKLGSEFQGDMDFYWKELNYKKAKILSSAELEEEAAAIFAEIYARDSEFRDVEERVWGGT